MAEPRFDHDAIERVRAQTIAGLRYQQNDPGVSATRRFSPKASRASLWPSDLGHHRERQGDHREDLVALHRAIVAKGHAKIAVVGAIDEERLAALLDKVFGALPDACRRRPSSRRRCGSAASGSSSISTFLQSVIRFGMNGVPVRDPDFIPAFVLNHILGGGAFTSRLFQEVREKRGLAYSVGTSLVSYRAAAMTWGYTATKNERVAEPRRHPGRDGAAQEAGPSDEDEGEGLSHGLLRARLRQLDQDRPP